MKTHDEEEILSVLEVAIDRSSTDITLKEHGKDWNSVQFTFFVEGENGLEEYDIFMNKKTFPKFIKLT